MTQKLYYEDAFLFEFDATVVDIREDGAKKAVILDKTAFFPEGGGQPGDEGYIGDTGILDTQIKDDDIYHYFSGETDFSVGDNVHCKLNGDLRFARMQAHSGEHIVSGIAHNVYGCENVGFHMNGTLMTVDFDKFLTREELYNIENLANKCVYSNVRIHADFPSAEELRSISYRSKLDEMEDTRIVTVEGIDTCACCAPHVSYSGQIGLIKILTSMRHRGGVRITLLCGSSAYADYVKKHDATLKIADLLAAKHGETDSAVESLLEKNKELSYKVKEKTLQFIVYVGEHTQNTSGNLVFCFNDFNNEDIKQAAIRLKEKCDGICIVLTGSDDGGYYFAMASSSVNVNDFTKNITSALKGSGGGRYEVAQGKLNATLSEIKSYFKELSVK